MSDFVEGDALLERYGVIEWEYRYFDRQFPSYDQNGDSVVIVNGTHALCDHRVAELSTAMEAANVAENHPPKEN